MLSESTINQFTNWLVKYWTPVPPYFRDISSYGNTSDYIAILNAAFIVDLLYIVLLYTTNLIPSNELKRWYETYRIGAVIADVLILVIGVIIARALYSVFFTQWSLWKFLSLALIIQVIHDILFYYMFMIAPKGYNVMLDHFKSYAKEVSWKAILGDSSMMILTVILASHLASHSWNGNIITLIVLTYLMPYIVWTK